jgi:hypothetical protein
MDKQTRNCYLRRAAIPCTQVLALGGLFAYLLGLISGYQSLAAIVVGFGIYFIANLL